MDKLRKELCDFMGVIEDIIDIIISYAQMAKVNELIKNIYMKNCGGYFTDGAILGNKLCLLHHGITGEYIEVIDMNTISFDGMIISEDRRMISEEVPSKSIRIKTDGDVSSLSTFNGKLFVTVGKDVMIYDEKGKLQNKMQCVHIQFVGKICENNRFELCCTISSVEFTR